MTDPPIPEGANDPYRDPPLGGARDLNSGWPPADPVQQSFYQNYVPNPEDRPPEGLGTPAAGEVADTRRAPGDRP